MERYVNVELSKEFFNSLAIEILLPVPVGPHIIGCLSQLIRVLRSLFILIESIVGTINLE